MGSDGEDLFAIDSYRAVKMAEYVGKYNLNNEVDFTAGTYSGVNHTAISADGRGEVRPVWELFYRYARDKGITAKYCQQWAENLRAANAWGEGGGGDYGTTSTGFDQLGYGTLMYADPTTADGQDTDATDYSAYNNSNLSATGDTYVRSDNADSKNGSAKQMEVRTNSSTTFSGLLSFKLPKAAVGHVKKAQLRLVTKRYKTGRNINIFAYESFSEGDATYTNQSTAITTALGKSQLATFKPMGQNGKDVTIDVASINDENKTLAKWTNKVDLTSYVQSLNSQEVNLLLTDAGTGTNNDAVQFFTKEWDTALSTATTGNAIEAAAADLVPLLVIYHDGTSTGVFEVSGDSYDTLEEALDAVADGGTITITGNAEVSARTTFTKSVTLKGKTGAEVIKRSSADAAMKQSVLFKANSGKTITMESFVFDDNSATVGQVIEVDNNTFNLKNLTVKNSKSTAANGIVSMKKGTLVLDNLTFDGCTISNAFVRAAAGTLTVSNGYTLTNSTGHHFRLGEVTLDASTLPAATYYIELENEKAKITNVADESKFVVATDGYMKNYNSSTKEITFTKESDGQDAAITSIPDGYTKSEKGADADTYVRSSAADSKYGSQVQMEIHNNADLSSDFAGLISFRLPGNSKAGGAVIEKVQLRLVSKRLKTKGGINIFAISDFSEKDATYTTMKDAVAAARQTTALAKFYSKGQYDTDITNDGAKISAENKTLEAWTNRIDLTAYAKGLEGRVINLLLSAATTDDGAVQFFTKEQGALEADADGKVAFAAAAADLVPQLIVVYKGSSEQKTFVIEDEGSFDTLEEALAEVSDGGTILISKNATIDGRVTFDKNVTIKGMTGNEVLQRGSSDAAMKQSVLFKANSGKTVIMTNFIYDDRGATVGQVIEIDNNTFVLDNLTIKNSYSTAANGVISMKKGTLTIDGLTFENCEISNAFVRLAGGTLNLKSAIKLDDSTGDHFRLGEVELDASQLPNISEAYRIEVENDKAKIVNVSDPDQFELTTIGYVMNYSNHTITFEEEPDGQDTESIDVPEGAVSVAVSSLADTFVRKGNTDNNGKKNYMEVRTYPSDDADFVGLLAFKLPNDLVAEGAKLHKAQLRLVSKRVKGGRIVDMYTFYRDFDESVVYSQMESLIEEMRQSEPMHRFHAKGESNMDVEADAGKISDDYKKISEWTNRIDLTELVGNAMYDDGKVRIAFIAPVSSKDAKQFYTKEAKAISNDVMNVSEDQLVPELTLIYTPGSGESTLTAKDIETMPNADTFVRKGSSQDNSISTAIEVYTFKDDDQDVDFVGLLSFNLSSEVQAARTRAQGNNLEVFSATLRLVTKRVRGERNMNVYAFSKPFSGNSTYSEMEDAIQQTRESAKYTTFKTAGQEGKDITTDSGLTGNYKTSILAWTNEIDLTEILKGSDTSTLRLMLSAPDNGKNSKQYFSSEAESFTNENNKDFIVGAEKLVPMLTISFRNPLYTDIEEVITIPANENIEIYDLQGRRVQSMGKGIYIVNGKKVLR